MLFCCGSDFDPDPPLGPELPTQRAQGEITQRARPFAKVSNDGLSIWWCMHTLVCVRACIHKGLLTQNIKYYEDLSTLCYIHSMTKDDERTGPNSLFILVSSTA